MDKDRRHNADDAALVASWRSGEFASFEALVGKYQKPMFNIAFRITGNYGYACEVVQDAFVDAYRGAVSLPGVSRFSTWLAALIVSHARNRLRQEPVQQGAPARLILPPAGGNSGIARDAAISSNAAEAARDDVLWHLQECIGSLLADLREVLVLKDLQNFSCTEIGTILNIQEATVKSRLCRAREVIAESLQRAGGGDGPR